VAWDNFKVSFFGIAHKLEPLYQQLRKGGVSEVICDFCAMAFQVKDDLRKNKVPLTSEYEGHLSVAKWTPYKKILKVLKHRFTIKPCSRNQ